MWEQAKDELCLQALGIPSGTWGCVGDILAGGKKANWQVWHGFERQSGNKAAGVERKRGTVAGLEGCG